MNRFSRALFFRTGLRGHVRHEIEREQLREQKAATKLEKQLQQLRESSAAQPATLERYAYQFYISKDLRNRHETPRSRHA